MKLLFFWHIYEPDRHSFACLRSISWRCYLIVTLEDWNRFHSCLLKQIDIPLCEVGLSMRLNNPLRCVVSVNSWLIYIKYMELWYKLLMDWQLLIFCCWTMIFYCCLEIGDIRSSQVSSDWFLHDQAEVSAVHGRRRIYSALTRTRACLLCWV
jgi:hypothetical protein